MSTFELQFLVVLTNGGLRLVRPLGTSKRDQVSEAFFEQTVSLHIAISCYLIKKTFQALYAKASMKL